MFGNILELICFPLLSNFDGYWKIGYQKDTQLDTKRQLFTKFVTFKTMSLITLAVLSRVHFSRFKFCKYFMRVVSKGKPPFK